MYCKNCGAEIGENDKFCRECGTPAQTDEKKENKTECNVDEYGMTKLNARFFKRVVIALLCIAIVFGAVTAYKNNRWKNNIDVKYIGYTGGSLPYYEWEITNESGKTLENVTIVFKVNNSVWDDFIFEQTVGVFGNMKKGETRAVKLYWNTVKKNAEEQGIELLMASVDILRITYD